MNKRYENFDGNISKIERTLQKIKEKEMSYFHLKGSSVRILVLLDQNREGITASSLTKQSGFDKAHISRVLKELYLQELITYESQSYSPHIYLTEKGKEVSKRVTDKIDVYVQKAGKNLTEEERLIFYKVLNTIAENIDEIYKEETK